VKAGRTVAISERGRVIALLSPPSEDRSTRRSRPWIGGYRSAKPLRAEEIIAELARGFGADHSR
jgi:antitoxin (DNA-binding transcriptional repressor) of toxin-antitoxin stability system